MFATAGSRREEASFPERWRNPSGMITDRSAKILDSTCYYVSKAIDWVKEQTEAKMTQNELDEKLLRLSGKESASLKALSKLLESGANPNAKTKDGSSPLHRAVRFKTKASSMLLVAGADPNARNSDGMTPMHIACFWQPEKVIELYDAGGDVSITNRFGVSVFDSIIDPDIARSILFRQIFAGFPESPEWAEVESASEAVLNK